MNAGSRVPSSARSAPGSTAPLRATTQAASRSAPASSGRAATAQSATWAAVKEMHSYTTPAILVLPIEGGEPGYLDWLMKETETR